MNPQPSYEELQTRIAELEAELHKRTFELNQRIRALKSVLQLTTAGDQLNRSLEDFYRSALDIVVESFQYPEITCAELKVGEETFQSRNFRATEWKLGWGLMEGSKMIGYLSVYYLEERPEEDFGPFTKEEKNLVVLITRYLVQIIRRKLSERQLEKFGMVISQSPNMILIADSQGRIEYCNERVTEVMGYTLDDLKGKLQIFTPDDEAGRANQKTMETTLIARGFYAGELEVERKDATRFWARATVTPVLKNGLPEFYVSVFDDITAERELKRQNTENQEKLNMIMENIPLSITLMDKKGYFIFYNEEARKNLRLSAEALSRQNLVELFPKEGPDTLESIRKIFDTKKPTYSEVSYLIQGTRYYFNIHRLPLFDSKGDVHSVMSIAQDITQQKKEEKLLKIQHAIDSLQSIGETFEESFRILFDNLFELDWLDVGGLYLANPDIHALELVYHRSLSPSFLAGTSVYSYDTPNARMVLAGRPLYANPEDFPEESKRKIVEEGLQLVIVLPLLYQGLVVGSLNLGSKKIAILDDNDKRALENIALKTANLLDVINTREMLSKANRELTKRLIDIREKQALLVQKSKLESLGEIAAGLAHEINQPLSVISLAFENILFKLQQTREHADYFSKKSETINMNIEKIRELIDHIRLFSRDQSSVMFEKVDLNEAVTSSISLLDIQLKKHHIHLEVNLCSEKCFTLGNMTKMEQVVMNLLSNARDAVDDQARQMKGGNYRKLIRISTIRQENKVVLVMEDNGTGITPENLEKIYNPFFTTKPPGQGTGLGLAMIYGIVTEMKGTIDITSELSKFTRAEIILPGI